MTRAYGEPWVYTPGEGEDGDIAGIYPHDDDTGVIADCYGYGTNTGNERAARIVACVNACDGIEDPAAALAEVRRLCAAATFGIGTDPGKAMLAQKILSLLGGAK